MKRKEKALAESISSAVEARVIDTGEQSKKLKKAIDRSADKLAKKLTKLLKKEEKRTSVDGAAGKFRKSKSESSQKAEANARPTTT